MCLDEVRFQPFPSPWSDATPLKYQRLGWSGLRGHVTKVFRILDQRYRLQSALGFGVNFLLVMDSSGL